MDNNIFPEGLASPEKLARQIHLEESMIARGMDRYRTTVANLNKSGRGDQTAAGMAMLRTVVEPLADKIRAWVEENTATGFGYRYSAYKLIKDADPTLIAYLTAGGVLALSYSYGSTIQNMAKAISNRIEEELRLADFAKSHEAYMNTLMEDFASRGSTVVHMRRALLAMMNKKGHEWAAWSQVEKLHLGTLLMDLLIEAKPGLFERARLFGPSRTKGGMVYIQLTDHAEEWLSHLHERGELWYPEMLPTVIPPKPWTGLTGGGYWTDTMVNPLTLVRRPSPAQREALAKADLSSVYASLNIIQNTPWRINKRIVEVADEVFHRSLDDRVLPSMVKLELPVKPVDKDTNKDALRKWKKEATDVHSKNHKLRSKRLQVLRILQLSNMFAEDEAIYFPHNLDFRGREYPVAHFLHPQGGDLERAILEFAKGDLIEDQTAKNWLAIQGANVWGMDKVPFEDRIRWVEENKANILRVDADPIGFRWWAEADSPFMFLAFCFEWAGLLRAGLGNFVSHIVVAQDGSCNGIQHFSAMLRDAVGGAAVNMVPADKPQDIYGEVAKNVELSLLSGVGHAEEPYAQRWLEWGINRKITKRPVMVLPYGGTISSCVKYVREAVAERCETETCPFVLDTWDDATLYLAKTVWSSIGSVITSARTAMDFLRKVSSVVTKQQRPIRWTTADGFPVVQEYADLSNKRIKTRLNGSLVYLTLKMDGDKLNGRRQAQAVSPNFVHSQDATALRKTVVTARASGLTNFAMVHDSYGTTAAKAETLAAILRHEFVTLYREHDVLAEFLASNSEGLREKDLEKLPELPPKGTLDIEQVNSARFFFA